MTLTEADSKHSGLMLDLVYICHLMKYCIVDKCIKAEGSDESAPSEGPRRASNKKLWKVGIKRRLQHHIHLTAKMGVPLLKAASTEEYIILAPNLDLEDGKYENLRCEKT